MSKFILVTGGSGSGKSAFAEACIAAGPENRYYLATMQIFGEEDRKKVDRHKKLRAGKGFFTIEEPTDPGKAMEHMDRKPAAVLLECMSNLTANVMFETDPPRTAQDVCEHILSGVKDLRAACELLVVVTNNIFEDGIEYDRATRAYMDALSQINLALAAQADEVYEVVVGIPLALKPERRPDEDIS